MAPFPYAIVPANDDEKFMLEALKQAWKAFENGEVPVGAILVHKSKIIARGNNQVEALKDATAHAEMLCLTSGEAALENWRLTNCTLYSTIEPCSMCAGALLLTRATTLVWGAPDVRHGANGSWIDLFAQKHPTHQIEIRKGVLEQPCAELMRTFFQKRRKNDL